jgi:hypothetical protein
MRSPGGPVGRVLPWGRCGPGSLVDLGWAGQYLPPGLFGTAVWVGPPDRGGA